MSDTVQHEQCCAVPFIPILEDAYLLSVEDVLAAVREMG